MKEEEDSSIHKDREREEYLSVGCEGAEDDHMQPCEEGGCKATWKRGIKLPCRERERERARAREREKERARERERERKREREREKARGLEHPRKVDVRLPGKRSSTPHSAKPVHLIITMIMWIRTRRLPIKNSLSATLRATPDHNRGRANVEQIRHSRLDSGLGLSHFQNENQSNHSICTTTCSPFTSS